MKLLPGTHQMGSGNDRNGQSRPARGLLRPSAGVRRSLKSGHEINHPVQWRLLPNSEADPRMCGLTGLQ